MSFIAIPSTTAATPADSYGLAAAVRAAAPRADLAIWVAVLNEHLTASGMTEPKVVAAFLGQCAVEAGDGFNDLAENTNYKNPERLVAIFPSRFPTLELARGYAGDSKRIANRAYAGKLGNGDEASGDGLRFRGSGLLQVTGRDNYAAFAVTLGATADSVADWIRTPAGAAASACWFWTTRGLSAPALAWNLDAITRGINGRAMLGHPQRVAASTAALRAMTVSGRPKP